MNRLNFNQSIGFPLETNILSEMQTAWSILNALGSIAGNFTILQGCTVIGTTVSDGVVFINGEVIEFKGGQLQENVIIVETPTVLEFEDNSEKEVIYTRFATFGVATTQYPWSSFKRGFETKQISEALGLKEDKTTVTALVERILALEARPASNIPIGLIAVWGQPVATIPAGWTEYVPLRGRMPVGLDTSNSLFDTLLNYGGSPTHTLTINEMPAHDHSTDPCGGANAVTGDIRAEPWEGVFGGGSKTGKTGGGVAFPIMNPFRIVHFIIYVG